VLAVVVVAALGGCAQIPSSSPVTTGRIVNLGGAAGQPPIGLIAALPTPGMSRRQIVSGFLRAQAVNTGGGSVARAYLTPATATRWHPRQTVVVYDDHRDRTAVAGGTVTVKSRRLARIAADGSWTTAPAPLILRFRLQRVAGDWRIQRPPTRDLLGSTDLPAIYGELDLEFLAPDATTGVPVPVVEPRAEPGLASLLVRALLAGPSQRYAGAVVSAFPSGTQLIGNVTVDGNGTADVNLSGDVRRLSPGRVQVAVAQLLATLGQVPEVAAVRLLVEGTPMTAPGLPAAVPVTAERGLLVAHPATHLTEVRPDGRAVRQAVGTQRASAAPGGRGSRVGRPTPLGRRWRGLRSAVVSSQGQVLAATSSGRGVALLDGRLDSKPSLVSRAHSIGSLQWSGRRGLAVIDHSRVVSVNRHRLRTLRLPARVTRAGIDAMAVAPDGVQVALLVGPRGHPVLEVGALSVENRLRGLAQVSIPQRPTGLAWASSSAIVTLVPAANHQWHLVTTDAAGFAVHRQRLPRALGTPTAVCATPGQPVTVVADGRLWMNRFGRWVRAGRAIACSYGG
jgi:hypothetical protein